MLSISPLSGGDQRYYLSLVNINYFTEGGEPPGVWFGLAAAELGLSGIVEKQHLERLCNGFHHLTGKALVQNAGVTKGDKARKPADDMTFSAPKDVSAIFAVADEDLRDAIRAAHARAVKVALDLAQDRAALARVGRNGQGHVFAPLIWALYEHSTSRAGDPQLHTHALLLNLTMLESGRCRTVDSTHMYFWKMALGAVYRAELARGMQRLGFDVERVEEGSSVYFRVRGVPEALTEFWSKRRAEIEAKLELGSLDAASSRAKEIANLETRRRKEDERPRSEMIAGWRADARSFGFTPDFVQDLLTPYQPPAAGELDRLKGEVWREALLKLSYHQAYWSEAEMTRVLAERSAGRLSAAELRELLASKIRSPELVTKGRLVTREKDARNRQYLARVEEQFTTPQVLALEKAMIARVVRMQAGPRHVVPRPIIDSVLLKYPSIEPEQRRAVEALTSGGPIRLLSGTAGTGKGFCLSACHEVWRLEGRDVIGVAEAGATAKRLQRDTGIKSSTMAMTLIRLASGQLTLSPRTTVVVDEAGMLGTAPLAKLLEFVEEAQAHLVLVGDADQLQPVQAGAPFKYIAKTAGDEAKLVNIRRQEERWAREAVHDFKAGRSSEALTKFIQHKRFVLADTRQEAIEKLVRQWQKDGGVRNPERVLMLAGLNCEVRELCLRAQAERIRAGVVDPERKFFANKVFFHVGDKIQFKQPSRFYDIVNSDTATVLAVDPERSRLTVRLDRDARVVEINLSPQSKRYSANHLRLAYAQTTHSAQGDTLPHCHVLLGRSDRHMAYVQASRSSVSTYLFINKLDAGPELKDIIRCLARARPKGMAHEIFPLDRTASVPSPAERRRIRNTPTFAPDDFPDVVRHPGRKPQRIPGLSA